MARKIVVVGAGPVGSLAALYAAVRGNDVEVYELRAGASATFGYGCMVTCQRCPRVSKHLFGYLKIHQPCTL